MQYNITEERIKDIFHGDDITEAYKSMKQPEQPIVESMPVNPDNAIRNMFTSKMFKGIVPDKDLQIIFKKGSNWDKLFGLDKVKKAWKELVDDEFVVKNGSNWKWVG